MRGHELQGLNPCCNGISYIPESEPPDQYHRIVLILVVMESRIYSLWINLLFLDLRSYALWNRLIVNIALLFRNSFRKCMLILSSNVGVWRLPKCTTDYFSADYPSLIFSQMIERFGVFWPLAKKALCSTHPRTMRFGSLKIQSQMMSKNFGNWN